MGGGSKSAERDNEGDIVSPSESNKSTEPKHHQEHVTLIDSEMIKYLPKKSDTSAILSDIQISHLCANFPSYMR